MTISLGNVAIQQFEDQFIIEYQGRKTLEETVQIRRGVIGDAYKWPKIGSAIMEPRGAPQSIIPASDVTHVQVTTTFQDLVLNTPTDIFQQAQVNASERQALAFDHSMAVGRAIDQTVIDGLVASGTTNNVPVGTTNMTLAKLLDASELLNIQDVDQNDRFIVMTPSQQKSLLKETETTSTDYNTTRVLVNGMIDTFVGFKFFYIPDRPEGGLPKTGNDRTCFAWQIRSMGMAFGGFEGGQANPSVTVDWDPLRQSWLTISKLRNGASALQAPGIVDIICDETA